MKQFSILFSLLLIGFCLSTSAQQMDKAPVVQTSLESSTPVHDFMIPEVMWDIEFNYDAETSLGFASLAGAVYFNDEFWVSQWNSETLFSLDSAGTPLDTFVIAAGPVNISGTRAMTADDTSIYIGNAGTTIYQVDPATRTRIGVINTTTFANGQGVRFITYDPSADNGNGGFWIGNFNTEIRLISRSGAVLQTIPTTVHGLGGMYGAAYDGQSPGGPYLWVFHQSNGPSSGVISQLSLVKGGVPTLEIRDVARDLTGNPNELAGGLFISDSLIAGKRILGGMLQSGNLFGYDLDFRIDTNDAVGVMVMPSPAYTQVPELFAFPVTDFTVEVLNQGITDPLSIDVTISVDSAGSTIYTGMSTNTSVTRYGRDTLVAPGIFSPIGKGNYELVATATAANGMEGDPSDDRTVFPYAVTDSVYARDNGNNNFTYNFFAPGFAGALFDIPSAGFVKAVEVVLNDVERQAGDTIYAVATASTNGFPDNFLALRGTPQIVNANQSTYYLPFPVSLPVNANSEWLFGIYKSDSISIASTTDFYEEGYNYFSGSILGWAPSGVASTRFIRPIIATCDGFAIAASASPDNGTGNGTVSVSFRGASGAINFQWDDPNFSTSPSVTGLSTGTYTITVTDANGCSATASATVGSNVSIEDELSKGIQEWKLYPNPTNGQFTSSLSLVQASEVSWEVVDLMGKVLQEKVSAQDFVHKQSFNLADLPAGVYVVKVHTALGTAHKTIVLK